MIMNVSTFATTAIVTTSTLKVVHMHCLAVSSLQRRKERMFYNNSEMYFMKHYATSLSSIGFKIKVNKNILIETHFKFLFV